MPRRLILSREIHSSLTGYVAAHAPLEACGLLAGRDDRVEKMIEVENLARSPVRFVMDPYEQLKAFDWIETNGLDLLGIFHSHPAGPGTPSSTDIAESAYEVVHLILSFNGLEWITRGFWIEDGVVKETSLQFVE